jgi:hypothetical protein
MPVPPEIQRAVEDLTDEGTMGFRASAIARRLKADIGAVTKPLLTLVEDGDLRLRFDIICPDNGRTIESYWEGEELPIGQPRSSDKCDSPEPFTVGKEHVWVTYVPSERFRTRVRRERVARAREPQTAPDDPAAGRRRCNRMTSPGTNAAESLASAGSTSTRPRS